MSFITKIKIFIKNIFDKDLFNTKWTCSACGKEIFGDGYFCEECLAKLPYNDGNICEHCGRATKQTEKYCLTCKNRLTAIDKGRSSFKYEKPISSLIKGLKYDKKKYIAEIFSESLANTYFKNFMSCDVITFVPMTAKAERKREYNHARLLAEGLSKRVGVPCEPLLEKTKETSRQAKLNRAERMKNLDGAFKTINRKLIKNKSVLVVDDVTTTGATAETVAEKLKNSGAREVILLTIASVSVDI